MKEKRIAREKGRQTEVDRKGKDLGGDKKIDIATHIIKAKEKDIFRKGRYTGH